MNNDSKPGALASTEGLGAGPEAWVCPWGICESNLAQRCRADLSMRGCGGVFPPHINAAQARVIVKPNWRPAESGGPSRVWWYRTKENPTGFLSLIAPENQPGGPGEYLVFSPDVDA